MTKDNTHKKKYPRKWEKRAPKLTKEEKETRKEFKSSRLIKRQPGAPPKLYSDEECIELGYDLIDWLHDPDGGLGATHFVRWYGVKHDMFEGEWTDLKRRVVFAPFVEKARKILAENIIKNKGVHQAHGARYLDLYDKDLAEHEERKEEKKLERQIRLKEKEATAQVMGIQALKDAISEGTLLNYLEQKESDE